MYKMIYRMTTWNIMLKDVLRRWRRWWKDISTIVIKEQCHDYEWQVVVISDPIVAQTEWAEWWRRLEQWASTPLIPPEQEKFLNSRHQFSCSLSFQHIHNAQKRCSCCPSFVHCSCCTHCCSCCKSSFFKLTFLYHSNRLIFQPCVNLGSFELGCHLAHLCYC